jgi:hypothetical protein
MSAEGDHAALSTHMAVGELLDTYSLTMSSLDWPISGDHLARAKRE